MWFLFRFHFGNKDLSKILLIFCKGSYNTQYTHVFMYNSTINKNIEVKKYI